MEWGKVFSHLTFHHKLKGRIRTSRALLLQHSKEPSPQSEGVERMLLGPKMRKKIKFSDKVKFVRVGSHYTLRVSPLSRSPLRPSSGREFCVLFGSESGIRQRNPDSIAGSFLVCVCVGVCACESNSNNNNP